jgi:hypothetical protein
MGDKTLKKEGERDVMEIIDLFKKGYEFEELVWISYQEIDDWDSLEKERKEVSRLKKMRGKIETFNPYLHSFITGVSIFGSIFEKRDLFSMDNFNLEFLHLVICF